VSAGAKKRRKLQGIKKWYGGKERAVHTGHRLRILGGGKLGKKEVRRRSEQLKRIAIYLKSKKGRMNKTREGSKRRTMLRKNIKGGLLSVGLF